MTDNQLKFAHITQRFEDRIDTLIARLHMAINSLLLAETIGQLLDD